MYLIPIIMCLLVLTNGIQVNCRGMHLVSLKLLLETKMTMILISKTQ
ncbi:unnamed protein product [Brassica oleracea]